MKRTTFSATLLTAFLLAVAASLARADTLRIPAGHDLFVTAADGRSFFYLGGSPENPIPEGFFGCVPSAGGCLPSDPVTAPVRVTFKGLATGDLGLEPGTLGNSPCKDVSDEHKFGRHCADGVGHFSSTSGPLPAEPEDTDTIVQRQADLVFGAVGDVRSAPIELVSLSLHSIEPIEVSYGGGRAFQRFAVEVPAPGAPMMTKRRPF